jgi:hypothetical protein
VYHTCRHTLYRTLNFYKCLPEDEPTGSEQVYVEYIAKIIIKLILTTVRLVGLHDTFL